LKDRFGNWKEILTSHIRLAKRDLAEDILQGLHLEGEPQWLNEAMQLWREAEVLVNSPFTQQTLTLEYLDGKTEQYTLISCPLPDGILLLYAPAGMQLDQMMDLLLGRAKISKSVLLRRTPSFTPLCILAARLESDLQLRTALPPAEYFDLMDQIILTSHQCCKDHGGIPGRSFGEGVVCFFLPEPDSRQDYLFQPLLCAQSLQKMVSDLDRQWKHRQAWNNTLRLNIAIHCGHDWLGTIPSPLAFEFTVVGDTLMETEKLGEFSQRGAIWASKKVIENLSPANRKRVEFGIRLGVYQEQFVSPNIYSPVGELLSREELERRGLQAISNLAVTEVINVFP
jgi:class 3 adenylate cyclase